MRFGEGDVSGLGLLLDDGVCFGGVEEAVPVVGCAVGEGLPSDESGEVVVEPLPSVLDGLPEDEEDDGLLVSDVVEVGMAVGSDSLLGVDAVQAATNRVGVTTAATLGHILPSCPKKPLGVSGLVGDCCLGVVSGPLFILHTSFGVFRFLALLIARHFKSGTY
ncbi:hypothetical protein CSA80_03705 [Candidatus Saccharibacteria bacterium]|nr:MAG: hypothetical protein CR973_01195 [Candidatus Saccharibacteria bacterium]PID99191.1 MAG: hypothetical protein CSA80_03705 [Candidatus Saccharibacteria bacterium]